MQLYLFVEVVLEFPIYKRFIPSDGISVFAVNVVPVEADAIVFESVISHNYKTNKPFQLIHELGFPTINNPNHFIFIKLPICIKDHWESS